MFQNGLIMTDAEYLNWNKKAWNSWAQLHYETDFYDVKGFMQGKSSLKAIELGLLGNIKGKKILHLQCHFGQDTISLARMGASVTGVDFSDKAIAIARRMNQELHLNAEFICTDLYSLPSVLDDQYDIVFTSYGTICWLPDMARWAGIIDRYMKQEGKLVMVEFHPAIAMFDDDFKKIKYDYFNRKAFEYDAVGSYAEKENTEKNKMAFWNHSLGSVLGNLLKRDLSIEHFQEYDYSAYDCFAHGKKIGADQYIIEHMGQKLPMMFSLVVSKR